MVEICFHKNTKLDLKIIVSPCGDMTRTLNPTLLTRAYIDQGSLLQKKTQKLITFLLTFGSLNSAVFCPLKAI